MRNNVIPFEESEDSKEFLDSIEFLLDYFERENEVSLVSFSRRKETLLFLLEEYKSNFAVLEEKRLTSLIWKTFRFLPSKPGTSKERRDSSEF